LALFGAKKKPSNVVLRRLRQQNP